MDDLDSVGANLRLGADRLEYRLLSRRPGVFNSAEGVAHIIDSMFNQHADWRELDLLATEQAEITRGRTWSASR